MLVGDQRYTKCLLKKTVATCMYSYDIYHHVYLEGLQFFSYAEQNDNVIMSYLL